MVFKNIILSLFLGLILFSFSGKALAQSCPSQTQYSSNYAILVGEIVDTGGENNIQAWFEWGLTSYLGNLTSQQNLYVSSVPYRFCYTLSNLNPCTTYYYRAAVRNSQGTGYGQIYSFTTRCQTPQSSLNISCYASPNPANVGTLVTFYSIISGGTGNYLYEWTGNCNSFSSTCQKSFANPGNYPVTLKVTSGNETKYTTCAVNIIQPTLTQPPQSSFNQPPVAIIAFSPDRISPGTIVTFDASRSYDPDGFIASYTWYINDQIVSKNISFSRALASGTYRIKLVVSDDKGTESIKEILISVGRNRYLTRTITRVVTTGSQIRFVSSPRLVDVLLDRSYKIKECSSQNIQFTLINKTYVNRQVDISVNGEVKDWFQPTKRTFILPPRSTEIVSWKINSPCQITQRNYEFIFKVSTPGERFEKNGILEIGSTPNIFASILGFIKGAPILGSIWGILILVLILLVLLAYFLYRYLRKKLTQIPNSSISQQT